MNTGCCRRSTIYFTARISPRVPRHVLLDKFILHQDATATSNLNIKIDGYDYDVLKFWALGREQMPASPNPRWRRLFRKNTAASPRDYFKRVVLAVRLKGHDRLYLKAFEIFH